MRGHTSMLGGILLFLRSAPALLWRKTNIPVAPSSSSFPPLQAP